MQEQKHPGAQLGLGGLGLLRAGAALHLRVPCPTTPLVRIVCWGELSHIPWCSEGTILAMHSEAIRGGALGSLWDKRDRTPAFHYQAKTPSPMLSLLVPELGFLVSGTAASKHMTVFRAAWGVGHPLGGLPGYLGASARRDERPRLSSKLNLSLSPGRVRETEACVCPPERGGWEPRPGGRAAGWGPHHARQRRVGPGAGAYGRGGAAA